MPKQPFLALITPIGDAGGGGGGGGPVDPGYSPPWARPGQPVYPDIGGPGDQPYPDQGLPGQQPRPDHGLPPFPSHPINLPPEAGGGPPLVIWGPNDPRPTPPIEIPDLPDEITPPPAQGGGGEPVPVEWKSGWTQEHGWVVVGVPTGPVPTPSKGKQGQAPIAPTTKKT